MKKNSFTLLKKELLNYSNIQIFLIISYVISWISISTSFIDIFYVFDRVNNQINIVNIINFFRQFLNIAIFPILLIIFIINTKKINFKKEILFIFAFLYFLFQIPGLIYTNNSLMNFVYIMSAFNILFIFIIANIYFDKRKYLIFIIILLSKLILISILNFKTLYIFFFTGDSAQSLYTFFSSSEFFFGKVSPRSTGASRTFLLIFIISLLLFYKFFEKHRYIQILFYLIIATTVLLFQSRTTIVLLLVFIISNFIFERKFSLYNFIKSSFIYIFFPLFLLYSTLLVKVEFSNSVVTGNEISNFEKFKLLKDDFQRPVDPNTYSSGRLNDWISILDKTNKSIFLGYGSQGDRYLINQSASNGLIYAFSSSGIFGLIFYVCLSLYCLLIICKVKFKSNSNFKQIYLSSVIVFLILLRSILESSYAVFSVDFIIIYTFMNFIIKFNSKGKNV